MTLSTEIRIAIEMGTSPRDVFAARITSNSSQGRGTRARRVARAIVERMIAQGKFGNQFDALNLYGN